MSRPVAITPVNRGNNLWKTAAAIGIVVDCCDLATLFQRATCHSPPLHRWRISLIKSTPAATIGYVEARTPKAPSGRQPKNSTSMTRTSNGGWLRSCIADRDAKRASYRYSPGAGGALSGPKPYEAMFRRSPAHRHSKRRSHLVFSQLPCTALRRRSSEDRSVCNSVEIK